MENNLINAGYDNFIVEIKNKIRKSQLQYDKLYTYFMVLFAILIL